MNSFTPMSEVGINLPQIHAMRFSRGVNTVTKTDKLVFSGFYSRNKIRS